MGAREWKGSFSIHILIAAFRIRLSDVCMMMDHKKMCCSFAIKVRAVPSLEP